MRFMTMIFQNLLRWSFGIFSKPMPCQEMQGDQLKEFFGLIGLGEEVITLVCPTLVKSCEARGHSVFRNSGC